MSVQATVASVRFRSTDGAFTYVTRMGWDPPHLGKWAHGWAYRYDRPIEDVHVAALAAAVADAKQKYGLDITITNPDAALRAARHALTAVETHDLRMAEAGALEPVGA